MKRAVMGLPLMLLVVVGVPGSATALPAVQLRGDQPDWIRLLSFQAPRTVTVGNGG